MMLRWIVIAALSGCSNLLGIADLTATPDGARAGDDAGVDTRLPGQAFISGTAKIVNGFADQPLAESRLDLVDDDTGAIGTTTVAQDGTYSLAFDTQAAGVDASIAVGPNPIFDYESAQVFPSVLTGDLAFDFKIFDRQTVETLGNLSGTAVDPTQTFLAMIAVDSMNQPVAGVSLQSLVGFQTHYGDIQGIPVDAQTQTSASGIAYVFNLPQALGTVTALRNGQQVGARTIGSPSSLQLVVLVTVDAQ